MDTLLCGLLKRIVRRGTLVVETANGRHFDFGDGTGPPLGLRFVDQAAQRRLLLNPSLAFGELFMDGRIVVTRGTIYDVLALASANLAWRDPPGVARALTHARSRLRRLNGRNSRLRARRNVAHHYDLDGRLYELFLDTDRQYSCAYFEQAGQDLESAQLAKRRHVAAKLLLEPGHRVLDIGSGWGGLALYLARHCSAAVTGVTLSQEQAAVARSRIQDDGLASHVDFRIEDFRDVAGQFDRIVSVGMFEHVGLADYDTFFRKVSDVLKDDGVMLLHSIERMDGPGATNPWIEKYIFPGGYAPALSEVLPSIERAGLIVTDIEILRLHYAETLKAWRGRFLARRYQAEVLYDERFCRLWEFYLAACECAFRHCGLMVFQIQLARRQDAVPLTRDYIAAREAALRRSEIGAGRVHVAAE